MGFCEVPIERERKEKRKGGEGEEGEKGKENLVNRVVLLASQVVLQVSDPQNAHECLHPILSRTFHPEKSLCFLLMGLSQVPRVPFSTCSSLLLWQGLARQSLSLPALLWALTAPDTRVACGSHLSETCSVWSQKLVCAKLAVEVTV